MRVSAVELMPGTITARYYRGILYDWEVQDYGLYLAHRDFESKEEYATYVTPDQHEYIVCFDGRPVAWFALENFYAEGEKLHFTPCPTLTTTEMRTLIRYLRALVKFATDRGAHLFAQWSDDPKYLPVRKLARLIGVTDARTYNQLQPQAA